MADLRGVVVSVKMAKTAVVSVERKIKHPKYSRILKRNKKYKVDTGAETVNVGDKVVISSTKPLSTGKYFKIAKIIK